MPHRLSKSRYTAGVQCHKLLWWKVHEPNAVELQPGKVLQDRFDQGAQVGALARDRFPGGVLVDLPHRAVDQRVKLTRKLIDGGAPAIAHGQRNLIPLSDSHSSLLPQSCPVIPTYSGGFVGS